jgi:hypothetical protein
VPSFEAKEKINFKSVQPKSTIVKTKYGSHDQHPTSCKSHTPLLIVPSTTRYSTFIITIDSHHVHTILTKC